MQSERLPGMLGPVPFFELARLVVDSDLDQNLEGRRPRTRGLFDEGRRRFTKARDCFGSVQIGFWRLDRLSFRAHVLSILAVRRSFKRTRQTTGEAQKRRRKEEHAALGFWSRSTYNRRVRFH